MVSPGALWIHQLFKRTSFWDSCWIHNSSLQFPESWRVSLSVSCNALPPPMELPTFCFFIFTIFRIDEINASQLSSNIELWFLVCPFLLFFLLGGFPNLVHISGHTFSGLVVAYFLSVSSRTTYIPREVLLFNGVNFVKPFHGSDKLLFESKFQ